MTATIESVNDKIETMNKDFKESLTAINKTVARIEVFQAELNHTNKTVDSLVVSNEKLSAQVNTMIPISEDFKIIKRCAIGVLVATVLGGGYIGKSSIENSTKENNKILELMEKQTKATVQIAEALKKK